MWTAASRRPRRRARAQGCARARCIAGQGRAHAAPVRCAAMRTSQRRGALRGDPGDGRVAAVADVRDRNAQSAQRAPGACLAGAMADARIQQRTPRGRIECGRIVCVHPSWGMRRPLYSTLRAAQDIKFVLDFTFSRLLWKPMTSFTVKHRASAGHNPNPNRRARRRTRRSSCWSSRSARCCGSR